MDATESFPVLPIFEFYYTDLDAVNTVIEKYVDADLEDNEVFFEFLMEAFSYKHTLYTITLLDNEKLNALTPPAIRWNLSSTISLC